MNKKWLKIGVGVATPLSVAGVVTGLVLGLKKNDNTPHIDQTIVTQSVKYFRDEIKPGGMQNAFLYSRHSKNLLDKYILLDSKKFDNKKEKIEKLIKKDEKGEKKPLESITIDFKKLLNKQQIDDKFDETNHKLFEFGKNNSNKRLGLYWDSNKANDSIIITIYQIKEMEEKYKRLIDNYIKYLEGKKVDASEWANKRKTEERKLDFPRMMATYVSLNKNDLQNFYPFDFTKTDTEKTENFSVLDSLTEQGDVLGQSQETVNNKIRNNEKVWQIVKAKAKQDKTQPSLTDSDDWLVSNLKWIDGMKIPFNAKLRWGRNFDMNLLENKIIVFQSPSIEFSEGPNTPSLLALNFTFYKLDKDSSLDFMGSSDIVKNPENIYFKKIVFNLKDDIIKPLADSQQLKTIENNSVNRNKVFNAFKDNWIKFIEKGSTASVLSMINNFIPAIGTTLRDFVSTFEFLSNIQKNDNDSNTFNNLFNEAYDTEKVKGMSLTQRIIEKLKASNYLEPATAFKIWFEKSFNSNYYITPDTNIIKFTLTDNYFNPSDKNGWDMSTQKALYYIYAGAKEFEPLIRERLNMLVKNGKIKTNYYDKISIDAISNFIRDLKNKNILNQDFSINDVQNETKRNAALTKIIKAIQENKKIIIPPELFGYFTSMDANISLLLSKVLASDYAPDLLKLIIGTNNPGETLNAVLKDPLNNLIGKIMANIDTEEGKKALKGLTEKSHIQELLKPIIPEKFSPIVDKLFNGFESEKDFVDSVSPLIDTGNSSNDPMAPIIKKFLNNHWKKLYEAMHTIPKKGLKNSSTEEIIDFIEGVIHFLDNDLRNLLTLAKGLKPALVKSINEKLNKIFNILSENNIIEPVGPPSHFINIKDKFSLKMMNDLMAKFHGKDDQYVADLNIKIGNKKISAIKELTDWSEEIIAGLKTEEGKKSTIETFFKLFIVNSLDTNEKKNEFFKNILPLKTIESKFKTNKENATKLAKLLKALI